jgi:hypothetical protein
VQAVSLMDVAPGGMKKAGMDELDSSKKLMLVP